MERLTFVRWFPVAVLLIRGTNLLDAQTTYSLAEVRYPGAASTSPQGINSNGEIVGVFSQTDGNASRTLSFLRNTDGSYVMLDYASPGATYAQAISDAGTIGGHVVSFNGGGFQGFLRSPDGKVTTFAYPGATTTFVNGVNSDGTAVGAYATSADSTHAFIRSADGTLTSIDPPNQTGLFGAVTASVAFGINNKGEIAGVYWIGADCTAAFVRSSAAQYRTLKVSGVCVPHEGTIAKTIERVSINDNSEVVVSYRQAFNPHFVIGSADLIASNGSVSRIVVKPALENFVITGINTVRTITGSYVEGTALRERSIGFVSANCRSISIDPHSASFSAAGGSMQVRVTATPGCLWQPTVPRWVKFPDEIDPLTEEGTLHFAGSKTLTFTVAANDTVTERFGTVVIADDSLVIRQAAGTCSYTFSQLITVPPFRGIGALGIGTAMTCPWTLTSMSDWIIVRGAGAGPREVPIDFAENTTDEVRRGAVVLNGEMVSIVVQQPSTTKGLAFMPLPLCRASDTIASASPLQSYATRTLTLSSSHCGVPLGAAGYALNVTLVPSGPTSVTVWPSRGSMPAVPTLTSSDGRIVSQTVFVPAAGDGSLDISSTGRTDVFIDVEGYFTTGFLGMTYIPHAEPCRAIDTMSSDERFGGGRPLTPAVPLRDFIPSACGQVSSVGYVLNVSAVTSGPLNYLTVWASGLDRPNGYLLSAPGADIVQNMITVPSGTGAGVSVFASSQYPTNVGFDVLGYWTSAGGARYFPLPPCRAVDTRGNGFTGEFGPPSLNPGTPRVFRLARTACAIAPWDLKAVVFSITAYPRGRLGSLSARPTRPPEAPSPGFTISTLSSLAGRVVSNTAIVADRGTRDGGVQVDVTGFDDSPVDITIDVVGYFAWP